MSAENRYRVAEPLANAVAHLHRSGILRAGVEPASVLVGLPGGYRGASGAPRKRLPCKASPFHVVLADFGSAVPISPQR